MFLRFASASVTSVNLTKQNVSPPVVLGIGDFYFESDFKQASPLNRAELKNLIEKIVEKEPRVVAIDLDLSPGPPAESGNNESERTVKDYTVAESALYGYLESEKAKESRFVLQLPFPVYDDSLRKRKLQWMRGMCGAGIEFGRVTIDSSYGMVTEIPRSFDRLSCSVHRAKGDEICASKSNNKKSKDDATEKKNNKEQSDKTRSTLCEKLNNDAEAKRLLMPLIDEPGGADQDKTHINFNFFRNFTFREVNKRSDIPVNLVGDVVFLGGVYGDGDRFNTPMGRIPGVILMAADYYSLIRPIPDHKVFELIMFLIEIWLGTILGLMFAKWWAWYFSSKEIGPAAVANLLACVCFPVGIGLILAVSSLSTLIMSFGLWLNPAPMVFGMFLEAFVSGTDRTPKTDKPTLQSLKEIWIQFASALLLIKKYQPVHTSARTDILFVTAIILYWGTILIAIGILFGQMFHMKF